MFRERTGFRDGRERRNMRIIKVISLICFLTIGVLAQQDTTVTGQLAKEGRIVVNTQIKLISQSDKTREFTTTTDSSGNYRFENVANGNYWIVYRDSNGRQQSQTVNVQDGELFFIDEPIREEVMVEISSGTEQSIEEVSKTVNVITAQELRERADFALPETLRTIPGFRVQQLGGFGRAASIKTRGLRNQDTAVLIDGIRFRDASFITGDASAFLSDFTLTSVDRIEVLRGSGSSLYGTNAIGGVIDFQTPRPRSGFHGQFSGAYGGYGLKRFRGNVSDGTTDGKFGFNLGASRTVYSEGVDGEDDAHNTNFQSRIEYNLFSRTNISGRFFVSDAFVRLNNSPDTIGTLPATNQTIISAVPLSEELLERYAAGQTITNFGGATFIPDANDPDNRQKSQFFAGQLALTQIINDKLIFQASYQGLRTQRRNENGESGVGFQPFGGTESSVFTGQIHTVNARLNWSPVRNNTLTAGYEYEWEKFGNEGFPPDASGNFSTRARQSSNTVYVQNLLGLFEDKLQLAGGFRAQFFSLQNPSFSETNAPYANLTLEDPPTAYTFDGAASYFFEKNGTKLRAHVGNGYRVPSLYERFGTFYSSFLGGFVALGDPGLQPEKSIAFDGGIEQSLFKNRARLTAVYFYTKLIDTIGYADTVPPIGNTNRPFGGYLNTKGGIARGAELSGQVRATNSTDVFASYTFTNSDQREPQVAGSGIIQTLGIPKHQFTFVFTQRIERLSLNFDFLATSEYLAPIFSNAVFRSYIYRFEGNRRGDVTARYEIPAFKERANFVIFGTIENVFDNEYYENGFRTFGRNGRVGLGFSF